MKTIGQWLGIVALGLVVFGLCGCKSTPTARPFITKWQGAAGSPLYIPIVGTYTLTWYNEATPDERHTEQVTVNTEMGEACPFVSNPYTFTPPTNGVYVVEAGPEGVERILMNFGESFSGQLFNGSSDKESFILLVISSLVDDFVSIFILSPKIFRTAIAVISNNLISCLKDGLGRAIVFF